nr:MAG TPA_asm: hypothetical protein [Caudoviricetes sp.]
MYLDGLALRPYTSGVDDDNKWSTTHTHTQGGFL